MRVLIAGDSALFRAAAGRVLAHARFDVVAEAAGAEDLVRKAGAHRPDAVVLDIRVPPARREDTLEAARTIRAQLPGTGLLLVSRHVDAAFAGALLEGGAAGFGYLLEERLPDVERFTDAIRHVARRGSVLDPEVVMRLLGPPSRDHALDALGDRDRDVLAHMAAGVSNHGIARRLHLSERAIERHVTAIFGALGLPASRHQHRRVLAVLAYLGHEVAGLA